MDEKIRAEFFSRRFSLMQGTILGQIDEELDDDVFAKLITANFLTVHWLVMRDKKALRINGKYSMYRLCTGGGRVLVGMRQNASHSCRVPMTTEF